MAVLRSVQGDHEYALGSRRLTLIGRDQACDIVVNVPTVSSRHAMIVNSGTAYDIEDLDSLNGTFVNRQRISQRTRLMPGDRIEIFGLAVTFHGDETAGPSDEATTLKGAAVSLPHGTLTMAGLPVGTDTARVLSSLDVSGELRLAVKPEAKLRAVLEISRTLSHSLELDIVLPEILESLFSIFPQADCGCVLLRDTNTGEFVPGALKHRGNQPGEPLPISRSVIQEVVLSGQALLCDDARHDARFETHASVRRLELRSILCVPLNREGGACLGIIQLTTTDKANQFRQEDLDLLVCCSLLAARAVELARLHVEWRELEAATQIQRTFLPIDRPECAGLEFFDYYSPAQHVGGDYYDYIPLPGDRLAVLIGDVAGKGVSAALLMARLSAAAHLCLSATDNVPQAVQHMSSLLMRAGREGRFCTLVLVVIELNRFQLTLVNAGHMPPIRRRAGHAAEEVGQEIIRVPLGVAAEPYEQTTIAFEPGDTLVLYTDGVSEARNSAGELYGTERVLSALQSAPHAAEVSGQALLKDVRRFAEGRPQGDDLTIVCLSRTTG
jgi:sigma-B regulation protein RsbU (phosphoserine phosphatase)